MPTHDRCIDEATFAALRAGDEVKLVWGDTEDTGVVVGHDAGKEKLLCDLPSGPRMYFLRTSVRAVLRTKGDGK